MTLNNFPQITQRIDTEQLAKIKNQLSLRDRTNADRYELSQAERKNPQVVFTEASDAGTLSKATLQSFKYPLELDGQGGLKLSSNYDRIGEQILEVLDTRIGERVYRPFFGIPEFLFEAIDESVLAQSITSQLKALLPLVPNLEVKVSLREDGTANLIVIYSVEGSENYMVKYSFTI